MAGSGRLLGIGVGPGDPELVTLKAARLIGEAALVAYFARRGGTGHARAIAAGHIRAGQAEFPMHYPVTVEVPVSDPEYGRLISAFYDDVAARIAAKLDEGGDVAILCEGDPFFYGSFMHLYHRLADRYETAIVPGVTGMSGCWTASRAPITYGDDTLVVLPGTLDEAALSARLAGADAAVIMKLGRNFPKVRRVLEAAGLADRAIYVERGTMADQRVMALRDKADDAAPYFSIVLLPGRGRRL